MSPLSASDGLVVQTTSRTLSYECQWTVLSGLLPYADIVELLVSPTPKGPDGTSTTSPTEGCLVTVHPGSSSSTSNKSQALSIAEASGLFKLLRDSLLERPNHDTHIALKLFVPTVTGYIARGDVLERRFEGCQLIRDVQSFVRPLQYIKPATEESRELDLYQILSHALGGITLRDGDSATQSAMLKLVDEQIVNRLSFQWILPEPIPRKRLAFVQGRGDPESSIRMWETASALGIDLVIFEAEGHWLQQSKWAHLYEAFVPTDITPDDDLPERLVKALKEYQKPFDGIMTVSDARLPAVAKTAKALGFTTNPAEAYIIAGDKFLTRELEPSAKESFECSSVEHLRSHLQDDSITKVKYPLIVKPCTGWGSECVTRVENAKELESAVEKAVGRHAGSVFKQTACVVEPYINGPEFDANFVLLDGQIIFSEVIDDYPSRADSGEAQHAGDFLETQIVLPSRLPASEKELIREQIGASILRQGFSGGVFHCEGRVRDSSVSYRLSSKGHYELARQDGKSSEAPSAYLIENNARPPGYMETVLVCMAYGVDYFAQQMLFALGQPEKQRFLALAQPFKQGAQFDGMLQFVAPRRSGRLVTDDPGRDLLERVPELRDQDNVPVAYSLKKKGDWINGPETSEITWLAWYIATSRKSLTDLLDIGALIQKEYRYELE